MCIIVATKMHRFLPLTKTEPFILTLRDRYSEVDEMKSETIAALSIFSIALILIGCTSPGQVFFPGVPNPPVSESGGLKSFSNWGEVSEFLKASQYGSYYGGYYGRGMLADMIALPSMANAKAGAMEEAGSQATDYSSTNIQVEGVDEADIVKNDGKYIYAVPQDNGYYYGNGETSSIVILDAYPAEKMKLISEIGVEGNVQEIFVYKDKLAAFGNDYGQDKYVMEETQGAAGSQQKIACVDCGMPSPYYNYNIAFMKVYDISDRENPKLEKTYEVKGSYVQSRMIGGKVYSIFQDGADYRYPMPLYAVDGVQKEIAPTEVKYFDWPDQSYNYDTFIGVDLDNLAKEESRKIVLMGYSQNVYVSQENMYITYTRYDSYYPMWEPYDQVYYKYFDEATKKKIADIDASEKSEWVKERLKVGVANEFLQRTVYNESSGLIEKATSLILQQEFNSKAESIAQRPWQQSERTVINKIALDNSFTYVAKGEVPGRALNQFSMDESGDYFRIATTVGQVSRGMMPTEQASSNNVYVLDGSLETVGSLEGLARGETIYSARFMGERLYLVTFKKIDPFFVINLSDPKNPKLEGKLKIPGYSDYLHIYDENHVIGLGKGAVAAEQGDFAWYQGVKLSLFDVSDISNPKEVAKYEIGDRGTDSYALQDHKAFLFSKSKNLLVIPITLAEIDESKYSSPLPASAYGDFTFQGAYVFSLTPQDGFTLRGRITHADEEELAKSGEYYWSNSNVKRSLYMDNYLYTVSDRFVKANGLGSLEEISSVQIAEQSPNPYWE